MSHIKKINLLTINEKPATTSRDVAKHFNKRHDNVLRDIENLDCSPQFTHLNFEVSEYKDPSGKVCKEYTVFRDGFIFLTMGFTGKLSGEYKEAYIYAFNEMERQRQQPPQTVLQQAPMTMNDVLKLGSTLEETTVKFIHTQQGDVINVTQLAQHITPEIINNLSTTPIPTTNKPLWISIIDALFEEIDNKGIPEKMRQNMLLAEETMTSSTDKNQRHLCLFFRASNMIAFFQKSPHLFDLLQGASIYSAKTLVQQLQHAGILAFAGKTKEKGIPLHPNTPLASRRVPHLVAIDLVVLERDYGMVMASRGEIATLR